MGRYRTMESQSLKGLMINTKVEIFCFFFIVVVVFGSVVARILKNKVSLVLEVLF